MTLKEAMSEAMEICGASPNFPAETRYIGFRYAGYYPQTEFYMSEREAKDTVMLVDYDSILEYRHPKTGLWLGADLRDSTDGFVYDAFTTDTETVLKLFEAYE